MASSVCLGNCARTANSTGIPHDGVGGCVFGLFCRAVAPKHAARARCALAYDRHGSSGPAPTSWLRAIPRRSGVGQQTRTGKRVCLSPCLISMRLTHTGQTGCLISLATSLQDQRASLAKTVKVRSQPCGAGLRRSCGGQDTPLPGIRVPPGPAILFEQDPTARHPLLGQPQLTRNTIVE